MAKQLIFLVHGMGKWEKGWSLETQQLIKELYARYQETTFPDFDDLCEFVEICYDQHFEALRDQWRADATAVTAAMAAGGLNAPAVKKLVKFAETPTADNGFNTHVLDVLLYRFVPQVTQQVRTSVARQILKPIVERPQTSLIKWSVIAHSLGTSVTHDTLAAMYGTQIPGLNWGTLTPGDLRARSITMLANVSRVLQQHPKVYESIVRPSILAKDGICDYFVTARHKWDPFTKPKCYDPTSDWPDLHTRQAGRLHNLEINAVEEFNVHDKHHYLRNPRVHIPVLRALVSKHLVDEQEETAAIQAFEAATPLAKVKKEVDRLEKLMLGENDNWLTIIARLAEYFNAVGLNPGGN